MYNLRKNNYNLKSKPSNIQTPLEVSQFIFELLSPYFNVGLKGGFIFDPCCGEGSLLKPWKQECYDVYGIDKESSNYVNKQTDFLSWDGWDAIILKTGKKIPWQLETKLVLCNPPFNGYAPKLGSEVWLDKILELFGKEVPIVLFTPIGFRLNLTFESGRHQKLTNGTYPEISSQIALPKNIFPKVIFHSEILIFNVKGLKNHYFYKPTK